MLSADVVTALIRQKVVDKAPSSKKALAAVQDAFNEWRSRERPLIRRDLAHAGVHGRLGAPDDDGRLPNTTSTSCWLPAGSCAKRSSA